MRNDGVEVTWRAYVPMKNGVEDVAQDELQRQLADAETAADP
jgi:hypothetical protein